MYKEPKKERKQGETKIPKTFSAKLYFNFVFFLVFPKTLKCNFGNYAIKLTTCLCVCVCLNVGNKDVFSHWEGAELLTGSLFWLNKSRRFFRYFFGKTDVSINSLLPAAEA